MTSRKSPVSVKDVAALAGVSVGTVSNVINSPTVVSEATRTRVEDAIVKLGWVRNESARQLRAGRSRSIGMVVLDIANPFFTDIISGVEDYVTGLGYTVQLGNSAQQVSREAQHLELFEEHRVRGLLFAPIHGAGDRVALLRRHGIPVVLVDRAADTSDYCSVSVDDVEGGRLAVAHLIELGHERVVFVGGPSTLQQVRDRRIGAEIGASRLAAEGLLMMSTPRLDVESGVRAASEIVAMPDLERPTAVFAANDLLAVGLLQGFVTFGMRVPDDVAIIGYDDITFAAAAAVPLSSIRQPRQTLGQRAAELLFEEVDALDQDTPHEHVQVRFTPELVVRRSTAGSAANPRSRP
ncbi:MAG TPA: LacI family DNA-binding transcriptional regulator [Propionibacteriaceae bacterium]